MALFGGGDQELRVTIKAKDEASKDLNRVQLSLGKLAGGFALGAAAVAGLRTGFRFLSNTVTESIREFEQQQQAVAQLNAVLRSTGNAAGLTAKEIIGMADALSKNTLYTDDAVLSAQNMLLTFTHITKDVFPDTIQAVLDISTALGQDLRSSAVQVGKALNDPIQGVSALQRVGVTFSNSQQEMIEQMVKSGRTMDAQRFILAELEREFGGSAESAYEAASSITKLEKNVGELKEEIGSGLTPAINNVFAAFQSVNSGMGRTTSIGRIVFKTFATIGEFAANTAAGVRLIAGEFVRLGSYVVQAATAVNGWDEAEKEAFSNFRESVDEGRDQFVDFALELKNRNRAVLESWGEVTDEARTFGEVGPAAYEATAQEAEAASKKMEDARRTITETRLQVEDFRDTLRGESRSLAELVVRQEQKVSDLRKDLTTELQREDPDFARARELRSQLDKEQAALTHSHSLQTQIPEELANERRRASLTDFERSIEDGTGRVMSQVQDFSRAISLNVDMRGAVAGDEGIRKIMQEVMNELNRQATLRAVAGA